jgi:hypothetical protein
MSDGLRSLSRWLLTVFAVAAAGCTSGSNDTNADEVTLEFVSISDSGVTVTLMNGLHHTIYIRGARQEPSGPVYVMYDDSEIECTTRPTSPDSAPEVGTSLFGIVHGIGAWTYSAVASKERATLMIDTKFPQRFRGGHCRLQVRLKDETVTGAAEFNP